MDTVTLLKGDVPYAVNSRDVPDKIAQGFRYPDVSQLPKESEDNLIKINLVKDPQSLRKKLDCTMAEAKSIIASQPYSSIQELEGLKTSVAWSSFQSKLVFDTEES